MKEPSPAKQLAAFIAKYSPEVAAEARKVLAAMRKRLPGAVEMVYDNYNWLVIGFGPTDRPSEAIFSIVLTPRWVTLCLLQGAKLPDPQRLLKGSGKQVRHIRLIDGTTLDTPAVRALMAETVARATVPFEESTRRRLIIKSISEAQRPRRPSAQTPRPRVKKPFKGPRAAACPRSPWPRSQVRPQKTMAAQ